MDGETRDLFVTVDDPKKHVCTMETYITYRVTTKVQHNVFLLLFFPSSLLVWLLKYILDIYAFNCFASSKGQELGVFQYLAIVLIV